jgi:hypothetical protein
VRVLRLNHIISVRIVCHARLREFIIVFVRAASARKRSGLVTLYRRITVTSTHRYRRASGTRLWLEFFRRRLSTRRTCKEIVNISALENYSFDVTRRVVRRAPIFRSRKSRTPNVPLSFRRVINASSAFPTDVWSFQNETAHASGGGEVLRCPSRQLFRSIDTPRLYCCYSVISALFSFSFLRDQTNGIDCLQRLFRKNTNRSDVNVTVHSVLNTLVPDRQTAVRFGRRAYTTIIHGGFRTPTDRSSKLNRRLFM